jgi:5-methylcytosine-specific restriction endonuclease McrA
MFTCDEPKPKRKAIPKAVKDAVWNKYIGEDKTEGKCYVCSKRTIHIQVFELAHNKAVAKGGKDNVANLRPTCLPCNRSMHEQSIEAFKAKHFGKAKKPGASSAGLEVRVKAHLSRQGYTECSKKHGFNVCAKKEGGLSDRDGYLVVGLNQEKTVTEDYIGAFMNKVNKFNNTISGEYIISPRVNGLIAYTGALSKGALGIVKGLKPPIKFKSFS